MHDPKRHSITLSDSSDQNLAHAVQDAFYNVHKQMEEGHDTYNYLEFLTAENN